MNRIIVSLAAGVSLAFASLAPASAQMIPSGSYQQSCSGIRVRGDELSARCTSSNGTRVRSTIALATCRGGDIANSNGQLVCNGGRYGHRRDGYGNGGYNNGGYNNGGYGNGMVGGSYQQSCTNVRMRGGLLTADCNAPNGGTMTSSIDARQCRGADIANRNGRLVCQ